ncbi:MAG: helix-turn-helix domain-containing protein [Marinilabiliaceae bacterium]|nr:helix-turn-helix domain-containing protein [Marinilabiliaceae bacterium]
MRNTFVSFIILTFLLVLPVASQQKTTDFQIDSILAILPQLPDTSKIEAMHKLIDLTTNLPSESYYIRMLREEARKQKDTRNETFALLRLTQYYYALDTDSVIIIGEETKNFARLHKHYDYMFAVISTIQRLNIRDGQVITALRLTEEAIIEAKELYEMIPIVALLNTMAMIYYSIEQYDEAMKYWKESIEWGKKRREQSAANIIDNYKSLASMSIYLDKPYDALQYADSLQVEIEHMNIIFPMRNTQLDIFYCMYHRAIAYAKINQPEQSFQEICTGETMYETQWKESNTVYGILLDDMYGAYYLSTRNYDKSLERYNRLLNYYEKTNSEVGIHFTKKEIANVYAEKGDYKAANELNLQIMQRKEELNKERFYAQLNEMRTIFHLDRAEFETQRKQVEIERQKLVNRTLAGSCFGLALVVAILVWSRRRIAQRNRELVRKLQEWAQIQPEKLLVQTSDTEQNINENEEVIDAMITEEDWHLFENFQKIIQQEYKDDSTSLEKIADKMNVNKNYLSRAVNQCSLKNFSTNINEFRIKEAIKLMSTKPKLYSFEGLAFEVGFKDRKTFYTSFKKNTGLTPSQFRNSL